MLIFFWDINTKGFASDGCAIACHMDIEGDTSAGRKFTDNPGETIDMCTSRMYGPVLWVRPMTSSWTVAVTVKPTRVGAEKAMSKPAAATRITSTKTKPTLPT